MSRMLRYLLLMMMSCLPIWMAKAQPTNHTIDSLLGVLNASKMDTNRVRTLIQLGIRYRTGFGPQYARPYIDTAMILSNQLGYTRGKANAENSLGFYYMEITEYDSAIVHFVSAFNLFKTIGFKLGAAQASNNLGVIYKQKFNYAEAMKWYNECFQICNEMDDNFGRNLALNNIGLVYTAQNMNIEALQIHTKRLKLNLETKDISETASTYISMGGSNYQLGHYTDALQNYLSALEIYEQLQDKRGTALAHLDIALLYQVQEKYEEALARRLIALKLFEEIEDKLSLANCYSSIGDIYMLQNKFEDALAYQQLSLQVSLDIVDTFSIAQCYASIGVILANQHHDSAALKNYLTSLPLFEKTGNKIKLAWMNHNIGSVICRLATIDKSAGHQVRFQEGIQYIEKGLALAREVDAIGIIKDGFKALSDAYSASEDYERALEYQNLYVALKDSLLNNETTRQLEQLRTQYEVEKAIASEKAQQDSLLAEQKFKSEREQAEINARHQLAIAEAKAQEERAVEAAKYRYLLQLAAAKTEQEKQLAEQQFQNELRLAEENAKHQIALADEKARQEKREAEAEDKAEAEEAKRKRITGMILGGVGLLGLVALFIILYQRQRTQKKKAIERAETIHKMTELELQSLRAQLNPHFMFNSLNAIQELILMEENDKSHTYLARFAKLLRMLLENANSPFIPLARELEFLQLYLSLEKLRIPELEFSMDIDPNIHTENIKIPNMILQPYIENAIWHGLSHKRGEKKLMIRVAKQDDITIYEIEDNGVGRQKAAELKSLYRKDHKSKGMELLTKRFKLLQQEYGAEINTTVSDVMANHQVAGTKVSIQVPTFLYEETAAL